MRHGLRKFVYFIATEDRAMVKIGCSDWPPRRLEALAAWAPYKLVILAVAPGNQYDEIALHTRYIALHSHHEWFRSSSEMLADIGRIAREGSLPEEFRGKKGNPNPLAKRGYRATAEYRKKISDAQRVRFIKTHRGAPLEHRINELLRAGCSPEEINAGVGYRVAITGFQGGTYAYLHSIKTPEDFDLAEAAVLAFSPLRQAA